MPIIQRDKKMDLTANNEIKAYTNPQRLIDSVRAKTEPRTLWTGEEFMLNSEYGEGMAQIFMREDMHFYRLKWQFAQTMHSIFLPEPEDSEYIDFCISTKGEIKSIILAKRDKEVLNNTKGDILHIFIKRKLLDVSDDELKRKLRLNPLFSSIQKPLRDILSTPPSGNKNALKLESNFLKFTHNYLEFVQKPLDERPTFMNSYVVSQLKEVKAFLADNFVNSPDLKSLSRKFGINKDYLIIGFRELYDTSPHKYIISLRLEKAKELLLSTDLPLKSVASQVGYVNYGHFIKLYVKKFGVIPSEERLRFNSEDS